MGFAIVRRLQVSRCGSPEMALVELSVVDQQYRAVLAGAKVTEVARGVLLAVSSLYEGSVPCAADHLDVAAVPQ